MEKEEWFALPREQRKQQISDWLDILMSIHDKTHPLCVPEGTQPPDKYKDKKDAVHQEMYKKATEASNLCWIKKEAKENIMATFKWEKELEGIGPKLVPAPPKDEKK